MNELNCDHTGEKYLSEIMTDIPLVTGKINLIVAPCGAGKTQYSIDYLAKQYKKVLFLTDTTNNKQKLERTKGTKEIIYVKDGFTIDEDVIEIYEAMEAKYIAYLEEHPDADDRELTENCGNIAGQHYESIKYKEVECYRIENVTVMTYHYCGKKLMEIEDGKKVKVNFDDFDLVVCDEPHNLIKYKSFSKSSTEYARCKTELINRIKAGVTAIGITATPREFINHFDNQLINIINLLHRNDIRQYHTINNYGFRSIDNLIKKLPFDKRIVIYTDKISAMRKIKEKIEAEFNIWYEEDIKIAMIFSIHSEEKMDELSLNVRQSIIDKGEIPDDVPIVIMNASCETGLDIYSHIDVMVAFTMNSDTKIQFRGRYRNDLMTYYFREKDKLDIEIPEEYLNRKLDAKAKAELSADIGERDLRNRELGWKGLRKLLIKTGQYQITDMRNKKERCSIITIVDDYDIVI